MFVKGFYEKNKKDCKKRDVGGAVPYDYLVFRDVGAPSPTVSPHACRMANITAAGDITYR